MLWWFILGLKVWCWNVSLIWMNIWLLWLLVFRFMVSYFWIVCWWCGCNLMILFLSRLWFMLLVRIRIWFCWSVFWCWFCLVNWVVVNFCWLFLDRCSSLLCRCRYGNGWWWILRFFLMLFYGSVNVLFWVL